MKKFIVLIILIFTFLGCASLQGKRVTLYPITSEDIITVPQTATIFIKAGTKLVKDGKVLQIWEEDTTYEIGFNGYYISDFYFKEIMEAEIN